MIRREFRILDVTIDTEGENHIYYPQVRRGVLGLFGIWRYIQGSLDWLDSEYVGGRSTKKDAIEDIEYYKRYNVLPLKVEIIKYDDQTNIKY